MLPLLLCKWWDTIQISKRVGRKRLATPDYGSKFEVNFGAWGIHDLLLSSITQSESSMQETWMKSKDPSTQVKLSKLLTYSSYHCQISQDEQRFQ